MQFIKQDSGAVTVDWVVLTAALVGLGLATMAVVSSGVEDVSTDIDTQLKSDGIIFSAFPSAAEVADWFIEGDPVFGQATAEAAFCEAEGQFRQAMFEAYGSYDEPFDCAAVSAPLRTDSAASYTNFSAFLEFPRQGYDNQLDYHQQNYAFLAAWQASDPKDMTALGTHIGTDAQLLANSSYGGDVDLMIRKEMYDSGRQLAILNYLEELAAQ